MNVMKQEEKDNVEKMSEHKLKLITGGATGGPDENWLGKREVGDVFLARPKNAKFDDPFMTVFQLLSITEDKAYAYLLINGHLEDKSQSAKGYVNTLVFSRNTTFGSLIGKVENS